MKRIVGLFLFLSLFACNSANQNKSKTVLDFGAFTIETPSTWKKVNVQGTDSYVGEIVIDEKDTMSFDLGWYPNTLSEHDVMFLDSSIVRPEDTFYKNDPDVVFVKHRMQADFDRYKKTDFSWDTIDGRQAKIVFPRNPGIGKVGVYIDSLWVSGSDIDRFNLYGENLKPENGRRFLEALKTLKFYKKSN